MDKGFILLSRNIIESEVFASQKLLKIWVWCLCKSNFKDRSVPLKIGRGETIVKVSRGSFIFGRHKAEEELFIDGSTVYKAIKQLEKLEMISIVSNNQYSIVTVNKYNEYQDSESYKVTTKEQPKNNQGTAEEQPRNTTNTLKQVNKDNKEDNINNSLMSEIKISDVEFNEVVNCEILEYSFDDFWKLYPNKNGKKLAKEKFEKLTKNQKEKIEQTLPIFITNIPFKEYNFPHATTYINQERFNDEIILNNNKNGKSKITDTDEFKQIVTAIRNDGERR